VPTFKNTVSIGLSWLKRLLCCYFCTRLRRLAP
jgi:hypothetical protein